MCKKGAEYWYLVEALPKMPNICKSLAEGRQNIQDYQSARRKCVQIHESCKVRAEGARKNLNIGKNNRTFKNELGKKNGTA